MCGRSSNRTAVKALFRACLLLSVLIPALFAVVATRNTRGRPLEEILWSGDRGIYETGGPGGDPRLYTLRDRSGISIPHPVFARWRDSLVYWSSADGALCFLAAKGPQRWINVRVLPSENWRPVSIEPTTHTVFINAEEQRNLSAGAYTAGTSTRVVSVDPITGASWRMIGVRWVDGAADSSAFSELIQDGDVEVSSGHRHELRLRHVSDYNWAYDSINDRGAVLNGWLAFVGPSGRRLWRSSVMQDAISLTLHPRLHQVWYQAHEPFLYRSRLVVWDYSGQKLANASYPMNLGRAVMVADDKLAPVLRRLWRSGT